MKHRFKVIEYVSYMVEEALGELSTRDAGNPQIMLAIKDCRQELHDRHDRQIKKRK